MRCSRRREKGGLESRVRALWLPAAFPARERTPGQVAGWQDVLRKEVIPAAGSPTATLLRLSPNHGVSPSAPPSLRLG